ncbi:MAG: class I SAM-dependent methyltransferase, partial [Chloroflexota bacterium]
MPSNYDILAEIHDEIGIGDFAERMTSRLLDYAQRNDWMGRQIAVLGSGSSESIRWLAQHSYVVTGVEQSQRMLELTQSALDTAGVSAQLILADFRAVTFLPHDMVLSLYTL